MMHPNFYSYRFKDHIDYRERLELPLAKEFLEKYDLISLYQNPDIVGFELVPLGVRFTSDTKMV